MQSLGFLLALSLPLFLQQLDSTGRTGRAELISPHRGEAVRIPAGEFVMGATQRDIEYAVTLCQAESPRICGQTNFRAETPAHRVRLSPYSIGLREVSNAEYEACVRAGACLPRAEHRLDPRLDAAQLPVVDVTWVEAQAYCRWRGGRLPTEAQWERAARGRAGSRFPWGDLWNPALCNHGRATSPRHDDLDGYRFAAPVTSYPASRSDFGLLNVAGNVWEWVADYYDDETYSQPGLVSDPTGPSSGALRVIRGGSWASPGFAVRTTIRGQGGELDRSIDIGFRCSWD